MVSNIFCFAEYMGTILPIDFHIFSRLLKPPTRYYIVCTLSKKSHYKLAKDGAVHRQAWQPRRISMPLRDVGALQMGIMGCSDKRIIILMKCSDNHEITIMRIMFSDIMGCSDNGIMGLLRRCCMQHGGGEIKLYKSREEWFWTFSKGNQKTVQRFRCLFFPHL